MLRAGSEFLAPAEGWAPSAPGPPAAATGALRAPHCQYSHSPSFFLHALQTDLLKEKLTGRT